MVVKEDRYDCTSKRAGNWNNDYGLIGTVIGIGLEV